MLNLLKSAIAQHPFYCVSLLKESIHRLSETCTPKTVLGTYIFSTSLRRRGYRRKIIDLKFLLLFVRWFDDRLFDFTTRCRGFYTKDTKLVEKSYLIITDRGRRPDSRSKALWPSASGVFFVVLVKNFYAPLW